MRRKPVPRASGASEKHKLLDEVLQRMKKSELIAELMELATIPECWHALEQRLDLRPETKDDLVNRTQKAISDATAYDYREINSSFDYDSAA